MAERQGRDSLTEQGWLVIDAAVRSKDRDLGETLISAYAIGSLAHGGFAAASSDVDLALLASDDAVDVPVERIRGEVQRNLPGALSVRLSVFHAAWASFGSPPPASRFPTIDRLDLMRSGVLVFGDDLRGRFGVEPTPGEVLEQALTAALVRNDPAGQRAEIDGSRRGPGVGTGRAAVGGHAALCRDLRQARPQPRPTPCRGDRRPRRGVRRRLRPIPGMNSPGIGRLP